MYSYTTTKRVPTFLCLKGLFRTKNYYLIKNTFKDNVILQ